MVKKPLQLLKQLYVPVATILLLALASHFIGEMKKIDPLTAAQNPRLTFQQNDSENDNKTLISEITKDEGFIANRVPVERNESVAHTALLFVGNSQAHAIMDKNPGDLVSSQWLQVFLDRAIPTNKDKIDVHLRSTPNLSMAELLMKVVRFGEQFKGHKLILVNSLVMDQFRFLSVRQALAAPDEITKNRIKLLLDESSEMKSAGMALKAFVDVDQATSEEKKEPTTAGAVEKFLDGVLNVSPLFADRMDLKYKVYLLYYSIRNRVFGINTSSVRRISEANYQANMEILELVLKYAKISGFQTFFYLAPIRPVEPRPINEEDLTRFRNDVPKLCEKYDAVCLDYINLVPEEYWTNYPEEASGTSDQRDFAHFTGRGHKCVAEQLMKDVLPKIKTSPLNRGDAP